MIFWVRFCPRRINRIWSTIGDGSGRDQCSSPPVSGSAGGGGGGGGGGGSGSGSGSATPTRPTDDDVVAMDTGGGGGGIPLNLEAKDLLDVTVSPRYQGMQTQIEHLVMDAVREQLNRRQGTDNITRSFLKFLISVCGLPDVRLTVVPKIEMWVMNPKVGLLAFMLNMGHVRFQR